MMTNTSIVWLLVALAAAPAVQAQERTGCFLAGIDAEIADASRITGDVGVNDAGGELRLGKRVVVTGGPAAADLVIVGDGSVVPTVAANRLVARRAQVGGLLDVALPLVPGFCAIASTECGGADVFVSRRASAGPLAPGSYGAVQLDDGATLRLGPGTYSFCRLRAARRAEIVTTGETSIDVRDELRIDDGGSLGPVGDDPLPIVNLHGSTAWFGMHVDVAVHLAAPSADLLLRRASRWRGSFCAAAFRTGRRTVLDCEASEPPPSTTTTTIAGTTTTTVAATSTTTSSSTTTTSTTTTTTSASSTTTTSLPATTTTTSTTSTTMVTTTTSTTTTTTIPPTATCGPLGLDVTVTLVYEPRLTGDIFGMFLLLNYPTSVSIPGSGTAATARARFTNLIGTQYRFVPSDVDSNANGTDDQGRTLITTTTVGIPPAAIERVRFDCPPSTVVQTEQFSCVVDSPSDSSGQGFPPEVAALFSCALSFAPAQ